jgi:hypothetical protein
MLSVIQIQDLENTLLTPVLRETIGQKASILAGIVPVEGGSTFRVESIGIDGDPIGSMDSHSPIEYRMVLPTVSSQIEVPAADRHRHSQHTDAQELLQTSADRTPGGDLGQIGLGERILPRGPLLSFGSSSVFQPAIRIGDGFTMQDVDDVAGCGCGILDRPNLPG